MRRERSAIPLDMYNTPDSVSDFYIRVTRLKIEDIEGEIIDKRKQIAEMEVMLCCDPNNTTLTNGISVLDKIIKEKIKIKKSFKTALIKIQKQGSRLFELVRGYGDDATD
jgi:hypothetical protein